MFDWRDLLAILGILSVTAMMILFLYAPVRALAAGPAVRPISFRQFLRTYPLQVIGISLLSLLATSGTWLALRSHHVGRLWQVGLVLLIAGPVIGIPLILLGGLKRGGKR